MERQHNVCQQCGHRWFEEVKVPVCPNCNGFMVNSNDPDDGPIEDDKEEGDL